jgi:hypothetical protein
VDPSDQPWLKAELKDCVRRRTYEPIARAEALALHSQAFPVSNAFVVTASKRRLIVNLKRQSKLFRTWPVKMETTEAFALQLRQDAHLLSFDIEKG